MATLILPYGVLVCLVSATVCGSNPGLKARLSQPGLNYVAQVGVDILSTRVSQIKIPDIHGSKSHNDYDITNMRVTSFVKPSTSIAVQPGRGLAWSLANLGISLHGDWRIKNKIFRKSGSFDGRVSGASVSVSVTLGATPAGQPTIAMTACSCSIADVDFKIHGGVIGFIVDLFKNKIDGIIKNDLQGEVCKQAASVIKSAAGTLANFKTKVAVGKQLVLDYGLVAPPGFSAGFLETFHRAEFYFVGDTSEAPFQPSPLPSPPSVGRMVTFWISDYVLNTAGYAMHKHGALHHTVTKKDLPPANETLLDLTCCPTCICIGKVIPAAGDKYPNATTEIELLTTAPPTVNIGTTQVSATFSANATLRARLSNESLAYLMTLKIDASSAVTPSFDGTVLRLSIASMSTKITILDTAVHPVSELALNLIAQAVELFVIPQLNAAGAHGIPLPRVDHVQFVNAALVLYQDAIGVSTDVKYIGQHDENTLYFETVDNI